jgi:cell division protein FtsI (penicillin-binding protein 3)
MDLEPKTRSRLQFLAAGAACWAALIGGRLLFLQIVHHGDYVRQARQQQMRMEEIPAARGAILDRNGQPLAMTIPVQAVCVNPLRVKDKKTAAAIFASILDVDRDKVLADMEQYAEDRRGYLVIKRKVTQEQVERLKSLPFDWIEYRNDNLRTYPNGRIAAHVLGGVDHEERGNGGIELSLDSTLRGRPGKQRMHTDSRRRGFDSEVVEQPQAGTNIRLTIDSRIQFAAEEYLKTAVEDNHCWTGSLVALDPETGDILAMANYPTYDPNDAIDAKDDLKSHLNLAISAPYEPGSVFKVITLTAALETTKLRPESVIDCGNGKIVVAGRVVHDHNSYSALSMADVLAKSSNVGAIRIGLTVGQEKLYDYVKKFGFGDRTGLPLPSEAPGRVWSLKRWQPTSIGSVAMGHEITATNLQLARAAAVVANGGRLIKPRLILAKQRPGEKEIPEPVEAPKQIIDGATAVTMASMMEGVVLHGTGRSAQPVGYSTAGKTGSAQIFRMDLRRYVSQYNASFMGFSPVNNPKIVICVTLNGATRYGGVVAAPVYKLLAQESLRVLDARKDLVVLPYLSKKSKQDDDKVALNDLPAAFDDNLQDAEPAEAPVALQPAAMVQQDDQTVVRYLNGAKVPTFTGKTLRKVLQVSVETGVPIDAMGSGIAKAQFPPAGSILPPGERVRVQFAR